MIDGSTKDLERALCFVLFWLEDLRQVGKRGRVAGWLG